MEVLGVLALLYLGTSLLTEGAAGLVGPKGRRLLSRFRGFPLGLAALLLGLASGSGTGLSLLGRGLLQAGVLPLYEAALLALGGTLGATAVVAVAGLGNQALAFGALSLALLWEGVARGRSPGVNRLLFGLGLVFLGLEFSQEAALSVEPWLSSFPPWLLFLTGFLLGYGLGSANLVALLALGLSRQGVDPQGALALVLGGGVGCTGPLLLRPTPEGLRLGLLLLLHRLALALPLLSVPSPGVFWAHVGYHALALLSFPLAFPLLHRLIAQLVPLPKPLAPKYLRPEALEDPLLARGLALREIARIGDAARAMLEGAWRALSQEQGREADLAPLEEKVDRLSREVLVYVAQLPQDALALPLLKAASELEHLADLAKRTLRKAERLWAQGLTFSLEGREELAQLTENTLRRLEKALTALATGDGALAQEVKEESPALLAQLEASRQAHLRRLRQREESKASTLTHLDLLLLLEELNEGINRLARLVEELRLPAGGNSKEPTAEG
ncbi:Na/Pi cotransporter family protein [Thermus islandicus]|uniref:Na/Pi cotransporter family protein n=1 Tax=Thermus islandicus TaxID=540988 RepID=UPI0003B3418B|nr:Na/Pi cotransporter family protein [Thermus islandicus]